MVRLSEADLGVMKPAAGAAGLKLESFLIGASLRFIAIDPDFRRQFHSPGRVSWGPQPERFAAAELLQLDLFDAQFAAVEKAASGVRYSLSGQPVEVTVAQFIVGAATRLLEHHARGNFRKLKADLSPFLSEKLPSIPVLDEAPPSPRGREPASPSGSAGSSPPTVIVSSSMLGLPVVSAGEDSLAGVWRAVDVAAPEPAKARGRAATPSQSSHPVNREERDERATWVPIRSPIVAPNVQPAPPLQNLGFNLRLGLVIGGVLVLSAVGTAVWASVFGSPTKPQREEPARTETVPREDLGELTKLPGKPIARGQSSLGEPPERKPVGIDRPKLPPPPDQPDSNDPNVRAAAQALKEITRQFHDKGSPSEDIDTLLRTVYGRPRVGADGRIVQFEQAAPEHRYDVFIQRAVASVAPVYPVPPALVKAVIKRESNFNPEAKSSAGAIGLMQVMPFNAAKVNLTVADLSAPETNILAGTRLLAVLLKYYDGDVIDALVAYNAKARPLFAPIPRNGETPGYVAAVLGFHKEFSESSSSR